MIEFFKHQLVSNQFMSAAIAAFILGFIGIQLKAMPVKAYNFIKSKLLFTATILEQDILYDEFESWFYSEYSEKYRNVEATSREQKNRDFPSMGGFDDNVNVYFKQKEGNFFIRYNGKIIFITKGREKLEHASDVRSLFLNQYHLTCINGSEVVKSLLEDCRIRALKRTKENEIKIFSHNPYGEWYISSKISSKNIENIFLDDDTKDKIISKLDGFGNSFEWYKKASIFYKMGLLFWGAPGNGKTSLSLSIATYTNRDIYCLDLNSISENSNLRKLFENLSKSAVLLIEDIDGFYIGRNPIKKDNKISFSTFLNCLDGAFFKEGLITIITTNKIENVDEALKRKGRMDIVVEIKKPTTREINKYITAFYGLQLNVGYYEGDLSMCDIQNICIEHPDNPASAMEKILEYQFKLQG
jgi:hypothetical protein